MKSAKALARLSMKPARLEGPVGGVQDLSPADIAAGLAGCRPGPVYFGLYKYSGDHDALNPLEQYVFAYVAMGAHGDGLFDDHQISLVCRYLTVWIRGISVETSNGLTEDERTWCRTLHKLARLLVDDAVFENRHKACGGTGFYKYAICKGCGGSGRKLISVSEQARRLNVSNHIYATQWQQLFERFVPLVQSWEQTVLRHLQHQLYDAKEQELARELANVR